MSKQLCLKWNNHTSNLLEVFENLLTAETFVDVTLACEGLSLKAHKIVLSACSPFFKNLFLENPSKHPIVIMKDIKFCDLQAVIKFVYCGEVNVNHDQLLSFLLTAETLKVKGLEKITAENRHVLGLEKQKNQTTVSSPPTAECLHSASIEKQKNVNPMTVSKPSSAENVHASSVGKQKNLKQMTVSTPTSPLIAENRHILDFGKQKNIIQATLPSTISTLSAKNKLDVGKKKQKNVKQIPLNTQSPDKKTTKPVLQGKRKRAGPRKRSFYDSSHSDDDEVAVIREGRISPDVEELSSDDSLFDFSRPIISSGGPSSLIMVSLHSAGGLNSSSKSHPSVNQDPKIADVNELDIEPSSLLEQTLIEENDPTFQNSMQFMQLPTPSGLEISRELISCPDSPSQALVSTSNSNLQAFPSSPEIKPENNPFEALSTSSVAGPSHSSGRLMMQMDHSEISVISGLSNSKDSCTVVSHKPAPKKRASGRKRQPKKLLPDSGIKKEPWEQVLHMCSECSYTNGNIEELVSHIEYHKKPAVQCEFCKMSFTELRSSENIPVDDKTEVECDICNHYFCSKMALLTHKLQHHY